MLSFKSVQSVWTTFHLVEYNNLTVTRDRAHTRKIAF